MARDLVTLTTDFGDGDAYVGAMKGAILTANPTARIVDVTHAAAQDVAAAARILAESTIYFPPDSVHLCVVDPAVGSDRAILYAEINGRRYVAPDNGVLSRLLDQRAADRLLCVATERFTRNGASATFHGRDVMGPLVGALSRTPGPALTEIGTPIDQIVRLPVSTSAVVAGMLVGAIESIDAFGNLITNIQRREFDAWAADQAATDATARCALKGDPLATPLARAYHEIPVGELGWLFGSSGWLEVMVNRGSAAEQSGRLGDEVTVHRVP